MPETSESAGSPQQERPSGSERPRPLRVLLAGGGLVAFLTAIALHSINDGAIGGLLQEVLPRATLIVWPLWVVLIYQVFRIHTRELVPPSAIGTSPVRWRPRHPRVVDQLIDERPAAEEHHH